MSESLESIKTVCKDRIRKVILQFSSSEAVRNSLQAKVDFAFDQISSLSSINGRYIEENITLKRYFVGKIAKSETLKGLIGASLVLAKSYFPAVDIASILHASKTLYDFEMRPILARCHDQDVSLKDFTKWMFIAVKAIGISVIYNQGLLLSICSMLESIENPDGIVMKYPTGGGKTDAVKRRLLVYELLAGNEAEAERYRSELISSISNKADRRRAGNRALILVFQPDEVEQLAQWPDDPYAALRDQLSHHVQPLTAYSPDQLDFLEHIHGLFADIPYFAAILYRPLATFYDQLITWQTTTPTSLTQLPQERSVLHGQFLDVAGARLEVHRDQKTKLYIAMIASKIIFLQTYCTALVSSFRMDLYPFQRQFRFLCQFFPVEFKGQDELAAMAQEWEWMLNFHFIARLIHATATGARRINQDMHFEIAQRLEGSGKSYSKGGDRKPCTERRLVIIEHVTGNFRRSRALIPVEKASTAVESVCQKNHHSPPTDMKESGKRRRMIKALPDIVVTPPLPAQIKSAYMHFDRVFDTSEELRCIEAAEKNGRFYADYNISAADNEEIRDAVVALTNMSLMTMSIQGTATNERIVANLPGPNVDGSVAGAGDALRSLSSSLMDSKELEEP